jgi:hypothetical protein
MAFSTGIGDRGGLRSPREEQSSFTGLGLTSPLRSTFGSQATSSNASDVRGQLHRRFTTNNIPTVNTPLSPIGQQRRQAAEPQEFTTAVRSSPSWCRKLVPRDAVACGPVFCASMCSMCMACLIAILRWASSLPDNPK